MNRVRHLAGMVLIVGTMLLLACAPQAAPAPAPQIPAPAAAPRAAPAPAPALPAAPARPAWETEWEKTLAAARQEAKVVLVTSAGGALRSSLADGFRKAYGIPVESISGSGADLVQRIGVERRAGIYSYDVYVGGGTITMVNFKPDGFIDPLEPAFILPELTDPQVIKKTWYQGQLLWIDSGHYALSNAAYPNYPMAINTTLVREGEITSYRDLLDPKWRGKVAMHDPTRPGVGSSFLAFSDAVLGWDFFVEFVRTKPQVTADMRQPVEWAAQGKFAVAVPPLTWALTEFIKAGAPIKGLIPKEGTWLAGGDGNGAIFNRRPHPNAARIFINWFFSKEGNALYTRTAGYHSTRLDVPTDYLRPDELRQEGMKYFVKDEEKTLLGMTALYRKARDVLSP